MPAPSFEQIQSFNHVTEQLKQAAVDEFLGELREGMTLEEVIDEATRIAEKFQLLGSELGAQWYDLCTELAGIDAEPAEVGEVDAEGIAERASKAVEAYPDEEPQKLFARFLTNEVQNSIRKTGNANLWRDYERGTAPGKWARVPVGDTCAWCLMLASNGAWYLTRESALGRSRDHYHDGCNCTAVYHADAESIEGYTKLEDYKSIYYDADNTRIAAHSGREPYPEDLEARIAAAKAAHQAKYEAGETDKKWTVYNEDLIVMRYMHPELH